jgi:hypothetical protein
LILGDDDLAEPAASVESQRLVPAGGRGASAKQWRLRPSRAAGRRRNWKVRADRFRVLRRRVGFLGRVHGAYRNLLIAAVQ